MTDVTCTYTAFNPTNVGLPGSIVFHSCTPDISNLNGLGYMDVVMIVAGMVILGVAISWFFHHLNKEAINELRHGAANIVTAHPAE